MKIYLTLNYLYIMTKHTFILFLLLFITISGYSASVIFNGTTNSDWATGSNWSGGAAPSNGDIAVIASGKSVVIGSGTTVNLDYVTLNANANLRNNGTLNITTVSAHPSVYIYSSGTNMFDNEGTLSINSTGSTNNNSFSIGTSTNATLKLNGSITISSSNNVSVVAGGSSSTVLVSGTGLTLGSIGSPVGFGFATTTSTGGALTIDTGTTITTYNSSSQVFYMDSNTSITNNGTLNMYTTTTGTSVHAISLWQTNSAVVTTFTNNGTVLASGFEQPTVFGGTTGYCQFVNTGTFSTTYPGVSSGSSGTSHGILSESNLPNVFINSGTMSFNASQLAIALNAKAYNGSFANTGTINITKGTIQSAGTAATPATYNTVDNNSGGVINFNYGVANGTTAATDRIIINNNSGATINGSCTFAASTLVTNAGSTLSPGDYSGGVSGIGKIILTKSAGGVKFPLAGDVKVQINGTATAGTDYDQLVCTELDVTSATVTATEGYTPALSDLIPVTYAATSKSGPFSSSTLPSGWIVDNTSGTSVGVKYYPNAPGAPTIGTASVGDTKASITFTAPVSNGGASITSYTVTSSPGGFNTSGASSPLIVTGLSNGVAYTFSVTAINIRGTGAASTASNSVTPSTSITISSSQNISTVLYTASSDLTVSAVGTLIIDQDATVHNVTLNAGAKLDLGNNTLSVTNLILQASKTTAPSIKLTHAMAVSGTVTLEKTLDSSIWYFMSFPSAVVVNNITQLSTTGVGTISGLGAGGATWYIKEYDGASRATNYGATSNWVAISAGSTLTANKGYAIGLADALTGDHVLSIPLSSSLVTAAESSTTVSVGLYGEGSAPASSVGWNLVGVPYLSNFFGSGVGANYLTFYNGSTYDQYAKASVSNITPFSAFFIQASTAGSTANLPFTLGSRQLVKSEILTDQSEQVQLNLTTATGTDHTNLIIDSVQSPAYEINQDLSKWISTGTDKPQVYTVLGGLNYAYNALPIESVQNLPLSVYTKQTGPATLSVDALQATSLNQLLLTDNSNGITTDLLTSNYNFTANAGTSNNRFLISAQRIATTSMQLNESKSDDPKVSIVNGKLMISGVSSKTSIRVFNTLGRMISNRETTASTLEIPLPITGIYTVNLLIGVKSVVTKVIKQ